VLAISSTNGTQTYLQDDLGSPLRLFDNIGAEHEAYGYDEFGVGYNTTSQSSIQPFSFTGYQHDNVTNMHYAQAREYSNKAGRFISEDFIHLVSEPNWYNYCNANPIKHIDLNGLYYITVSNDTTFTMPERPAPTDGTPMTPTSSIHFDVLDVQVVSLHFSNRLTSGLSTIANFIPFGSFGERLTERFLGVAGGASSTSEIEALVSLIGGIGSKVLAGTPQIAFNTVYSAYSYNKALNNIIGNSSRLTLDRIIQGFWEEHGIRTSHTATLFNGMPMNGGNTVPFYIDLLTRQMQASDAFVFNNADYFLHNIVGVNISLHEIDLSLASRRTQSALNRRIDRYVDQYRRGLMQMRVANHPNMPMFSPSEARRQAEQFRTILMQFETRMDLANNLFRDAMSLVGGICG